MVSEWRSVTAGVPQGTKFYPWLFLIMINDLDTSADMWKYVDDISVSKIVERGRESELQVAVDDLATQSSREGFQLSETKCKDFWIGFSNTTSDFDPIVLNGKPLEIVTSAKLLGLNLTGQRSEVEHTYIGTYQKGVSPTILLETTEEMPGRTERTDCILHYMHSPDPRIRLPYFPPRCP